MAVVGGLMLAACGGSATSEESVRPLDEVAAPTSTAPPATAPPPTTVAPTTTEPDEWAIPNDPDAAYFERVLNELERLSTEVARDMLDNREFTATAERIVRSTRDSGDLDVVLEFWATVDPFGETMDLLALDADPVVSDVELMERSDGCAVLRATVSFDGVYELPREPDETLYLVRTAAADELNPTGWRIHEGSIFGELESSCEA
ncbi:MAG: hypothetical protein AAGD18_13015 [Actinomycetota bacterium]